MKDRHQKILEMLCLVADEVDNSSRARVSSGVFYKGDLISLGTNSSRTHPFQAKYSKNPFSISWHAETNAIFNAYRLGLTYDEFSRADLYVCRAKYERSGQKIPIWGLSMPCSGCQKCVRAFGIRNVFFSLESHNFSYSKF